ncbi:MULTISPECIES: LysR family transcriptional regulator [Agrobacterium]|uniref:Transcriptional regulator n=1 Tax=Agrobacterium deltaense NCPPB 1641 TaxID=1183425 RepID=A0A1S7TIC0_9HYPH|nr:MULTISPECIES: LysR family transcriptional regulator [Agrobacterium]QNP82372.1 LysR family transcriptional regulator [Agrobacterium tumefaciens]WFS65141.1 LysR family transcriptional regulator [Agrobacterium leguminum]CVI54300.1 Transcriptional regulator [Agrobacterium deltaense NCPPB 1641]
MQPITMKYVLAVARYGSIAEAASRLNVAGSAISRQIVKIEEQLGVELFERRSRGMVPSAAGEIFVAHARRSELEAARTIHEINELRGPHRGHVRIAAFDGFALDPLPSLMTEFRSAHPQVTFDLWLGDSFEISRQVKDGETDIGVIFNHPAPRGVEVVHVSRRQVSIVVPMKHPLATRSSVSLKDVARYPLALPNKSRTQRQMIDTAFAMHAISIEPVLSSNSVSAMRQFAKSSGAIVLSSSRKEDEAYAEGLMVVPIHDDGITQSVIHVIVMERRTLPSAAREFLELVVSALRSGD